MARLGKMVWSGYLTEAAWLHGHGKRGARSCSYPRPYMHELLVCPYQKQQNTHTRRIMMATGATTTTADPTTWQTSRTFIITALSFVAAFLWRDVVHHMLTSLTKFLGDRLMSRHQSWLISSPVQLVVAVGFTYMAARVIVWLQTVNNIPDTA